MENIKVIIKFIINIQGMKWWYMRVKRVSGDNDLNSFKGNIIKHVCQEFPLNF